MKCCQKKEAEADQLPVVWMEDPSQLAGKIAAPGTLRKPGSRTNPMLCPLVFSGSDCQALGICCGAWEPGWCISLIHQWSLNTPSTFKIFALFKYHYTYDLLLLL